MLLLGFFCLALMVAVHCRDIPIRRRFRPTLIEAPAEVDAVQSIDVHHRFGCTNRSGGAGDDYAGWYRNLGHDVRSVGLDRRSRCDDVHRIVSRHLVGRRQCSHKADGEGVERRFGMALNESTAAWGCRPRSTAAHACDANRRDERR